MHKKIKKKQWKQGIFRYVKPTRRVGGNADILSLPGL